MKQYIDKTAVVAEIERRRKLVSDPVLSDNDLMIGEKNALFNLLSFINTLEVKEVDLEKEFYDFLDILIGKDNGHLSEDELFCIAKHFFELGLKMKGGDE